MKTQTRRLFTLLLGTAMLALAPLARAAEGTITPFNGKDLTGWKPKTEGRTASQWRVGHAAPDPANPKRFLVTAGSELVNDTTGHGKSLDLYSEALHGDAVITLEVMVPKESNSGIYVMGEYEIQVLDSFGRDASPGPGDMGAIYGAQPPKNPKYRAPGEWNTYAIHWQAPKFDADGTKTANAKFLKIVLNGAVIHENLEMKGPTPGGVDGKEKAKGPLMFQGNHGPVAYRNIQIAPLSQPTASIGVGAQPAPGAEVIFDGSRAMLDAKWTYWQGPGFKSSLPIKWKIVDDPVDQGTVVQTDDRAADGGKYGAADMVTKKAYRDFRLHIEFLVMKPGGNSGVYLQNRYEIQVLDGDRTKHGMGAVINEADSPYDAYNGVGKWNAYDIVFRAARFQDGKKTEPPMVTLYFNGKKAHVNQKISQVWGGPNSGLDGGNDGGKGITDTPGGLKLQAEGHDVRYRNIWIKELDLEAPNTDIPF